MNIIIFSDAIFFLEKLDTFIESYILHYTVEYLEFNLFESAYFLK